MTGLPKDIQNAKATVYYQEQVEDQRHPKNVNVAEGVEIKDGKVALPTGKTSWQNLIRQQKRNPNEKS